MGRHLLCISTVAVLAFALGWWTEGFGNPQSRRIESAQAKARQGKSGSLASKFLEAFPDEQDTESMEVQRERLSKIDDLLRREAFELAWLSKAVEGIRGCVGVSPFLRERKGIEGAQRVVRLWARHDSAACVAALPDVSDEIH